MQWSLLYSILFCASKNECYLQPTKLISWLTTSLPILKKTLSYIYSNFYFQLDLLFLFKHDSPVLKSYQLWTNLPSTHFPLISILIIAQKMSIFFSIHLDLAFITSMPEKWLFLRFLAISIFLNPVDIF